MWSAKTNFSFRLIKTGSPAAKPPLAILFIGSVSLALENGNSPLPPQRRIISKSSMPSPLGERARMRGHTLAFILRQPHLLDSASPSGYKCDIIKRHKYKYLRQRKYCRNISLLGGVRFFSS